MNIVLKDPSSNCLFGRRRHCATARPNDRNQTAARRQSIEEFFGAAQKRIAPDACQYLLDTIGGFAARLGEFAKALEAGDRRALAEMIESGAEAKRGETCLERT